MYIYKYKQICYFDMTDLLSRDNELLSRDINLLSQDNKFVISR